MFAPPPAPLPAGLLLLLVHSGGSLVIHQMTNNVSEECVVLLLELTIQECEFVKIMEEFGHMGTYKL